MKKLLIIMAIILSMSMVTGCQSEDTGIAPEEIVKTFFDDAFSRNLGAYENYFVEDSNEHEAYDEFKNLDSATGSIKEITDMLGEESASEVINAIYDLFDYEIVNVTKEKDSAIIEVTMTMPDFDKVEFNEEEMLKLVMGIDVENATEDEILAWMSEKGLNPESSEEEVITALSEDLVKYIIDVMKNAPMTDEKGFVSVERTEDGGWKISKLN